ncbi:aspartic peptidase domain-containing protein [Paraphoma chrysanthemicola]|uniref:Aspartic peptidase domain-containing protein n=1 Tax=Paraphoma chrysanthemicola TaxID=798071 RepID=A0A8K0VZF6_9PLEO|nr:aspartic peptidase domain-containing protein [Paraphoma chrysanthemicola]
MANSSSARTPAPFSFAASQYFDGPDGQWSSFVVRVGTPEQSFRVLPSTVASETYVPLAGACKDGSPANCPFLRGVEMYKGRPNNGFQAQDSTSWHEIGIYQVEARPELRYNASGLYGLDTLGLMIANSGGPVLQNQVIAGVVNPRFWVGRLGMDVKPSNFSEFENPQRSLIQTLKDENYIPSLSYSYTAGAYYKKPNAFGSLIYGGYDQSRFIPNNITFPFDANDSRKPSLNIQSIVTQDFANTTWNMLPDGPAYSLIDFAEPQMWLPRSACDAFARTFNLTYDNTTDLYLISPSTRARLLERNPTITFGLGTTANPAERVNIVLPYSAFDQQASYPIFPNATNYFPIRRADNETQYTIGRVFFQEAYVRIDYDRGNFSVHQALFPATNEKTNIVPILTPAPDVRPPNGTMQMKRPVALNKASIAGLTVGCVAAIIVIVCAILWFLRRQRRARQKVVRLGKEEEVNMELADQPKLETDGVAFHEKDSGQRVEMESHVRHELQTFDKSRISNVRRTVLDLDAIFELYDDNESTIQELVELYEMDNTEVGTQELDFAVPSKNQPPPGWI